MIIVSLKELEGFLVPVSVRRMKLADDIFLLKFLVYCLEFLCAEVVSVCIANDLLNKILRLVTDARGKHCGFGLINEFLVGDIMPSEETLHQVNALHLVHCGIHKHVAGIMKPCGRK